MALERRLLSRLTAQPPMYRKQQEQEQAEEEEEEEEDHGIVMRIVTAVSYRNC